MAPPARTKSVIAKSARLVPQQGQRTLMSLPVQWSRDVEHTLPSSSGQMRQATLQSLSGVVDWSRGERHATALDGVPTTLYLGEADVINLRERLSAAAANGDEDACLAVLTRLAAMPCTRPLLESTDIGVVVGRLREHSSPALSELAAKLVKVWKGQLAEHRSQVATAGKR